MKLYVANTSPYARKARMVVIEKGLEDRVELISRNPYDESPDLKAANPLGKVPALVTDDGAAIFDSPVICAYLDGLSDESPLIPASADRWRVLTAEALTDGILDAAYNTVMERRRPEEERSEMWQERWASAIFRSVDAVEADLEGFQGPLSLAQIGLGAALGYLDFRLPDLAWREAHPRSAEWFAAFTQRPSMQQTDPAG